MNKAERFADSLIRFVSKDEYLTLDQKNKIQSFIVGNLQELTVKASIDSEMCRVYKIDTDNFLDDEKCAYMDNELKFALGHEAIKLASIERGQEAFSHTISKSIFVLR